MKKQIEEIVGKIESGHLEPEEATEALLLLCSSSLQLPSLKELNTEMKQLSEKLDTDSKQTEKIYFEAGFGYCHHIIDEKLNK